jgi:Tfp pilus assembly protein PilV
VPRAGRGGFTLVEVVIAAVIVLLGIAGIVAAVLRLMHSNAYSARATRAVEQAQLLAESMFASSATNGTSGSDTSGMFSRSWSLSPPTSGVHRVVSTVTWTEEQGRTTSVRLDSLRMQEGAGLVMPPMTNYPPGIPTP